MSASDAPKAQARARTLLKRNHQAEFKAIVGELAMAEGWPRTRTSGQRNSSANQELKVRYPDEYRALYLEAREAIEPGWHDKRAEALAARRARPTEADRARSLRRRANKRRERAAALIEEAERLEAEAKDIEGRAR